MEELQVPPLEVLRERRSAKWRSFDADVLPLPVAEHDFELAPPVAEALRTAVERSDTGDAMAVPEGGRALGHRVGLGGAGAGRLAGGLSCGTVGVGARPAARRAGGRRGGRRG